LGFYLLLWDNAKRKPYTGNQFVRFGEKGEVERPLLYSTICGSFFISQRRIVARVDLLMSLCDKIEVGLMRSQADSERLMEAVVGRMLAE